MNGIKNSCLQELQKNILSLQGYKCLYTENTFSIDFKPIENAFPTNSFPIGCMHEFMCHAETSIPVTNGFISCLLSKLIKFRGVCMWISTSRTIFPAALKNFGIEPEQVVFIDLKNERDALYATEEALQCSKLTAVISDLKDVSFKESRRFQLAAEQSRVTGFILRNQPHSINTIACVSRWGITSIPSELNDDMPGVGFPRWHVELLKVRNGTPGSWNIEWSSNKFTEIKESKTEFEHEKIRKIG